MSGSQTQSRSAAALRLYEGRLRRAEKEFDDAQRALADAKIELDAAERAYEAARHVFQAAESDRTRELGLDKVAPLTMSWIRALLEYPHAGSAELAEAAAAVGWQADHDAIRQQASRFAKTGVLERVDRGVYRVAERVRDILEAAPPDPDEGDRQSAADLIGGTSQRSTAAETDMETNELNVSDDLSELQRDSQPRHAAPERRGIDDEFDDDPAF